MNKFTPPLSEKDMNTLFNQPAGEPVNEASLMEECTCGDHDPCESLKKGDLCESAKAAIMVTPKGWRTYKPDFTGRLN